jgi:phage terminase large subunit-like protein
MVFEAFCARIGLALEPFQRRIARAATGPERELVALLPRGNGKTTLLAAIAKHGRCGWRLDRPNRSSKIDAVVALAMAVDRHAWKPEEPRVVGWL